MRQFPLALLMIALTQPVATAQTSDSTALVADYTRRAESGDLELMVVHLNDFTTDALFSAPTKYALRAQARTNTMFFVQGVAKNDTTVDTEYEVAQISELTQQGTTLRTTPVNISNFEAGTRLGAGEQFQGIIYSPSRALNLRNPFDVKVGELRVEFRLSGDAVDRLAR